MPNNANGRLIFFVDGVLSRSMSSNPPLPSLSGRCASNVVLFFPPLFPWHLPLMQRDFRKQYYSNIGVLHDARTVAGFPHRRQC